MLQQMQKSMHFQFWVLNSIEIRINELDKRQKKIEKILEGLEDKKEDNINNTKDENKKADCSEGKLKNE